VRGWAVSITALLFLAGWLCLVGYGTGPCTSPPEVFGIVMAGMPHACLFRASFETLWMRVRANGQLSVRLTRARPWTVKQALKNRTPKPIWASHGRTKPVVLVFGSYT